MRFPDPVISVAVEPKARADVDKMSTALYKMVKADPSLRLEVDQETGQTLLRGMGELHLEVTIDRMRTELGVEANMGRPRVSFRESFGRTESRRIYTHKKQTGGSGQFAEVKMIFEPLGAGSGIEFSDEVVGGRIPREYIPAVEKAIMSESQARAGGRATKSSTSGRACSTASTTTSTAPRSRSRSRPARASASRTSRARRSSSSRS